MHVRPLRALYNFFRLALKAVKTVAMDINGKREVDIKRYARIEKVFLHYRPL